MIKIQDRTVCAYTVIFLHTKEDVLLLRRSSHKEVNPNKLSGLGGKVEKRESILESVHREFQEESGVLLHAPTLKGTLTIIDEKPVIRVLYIYTANYYEGNLKQQNIEGQLEWHGLDNIAKLTDLAEPQKLFLKQVLHSADFYTGIAVYRQGKLVEYSDSKPCFGTSPRNQ